MRRSRAILVLTVAFLAMIAAPAPLQTLVEARHGTWPRVLDIFSQRPTPVNLRAYESDLQQASVTARTLRPWMQAGQFLGLRDAGEKALTARGGWMFYQPGISFLTQRRAARESTPEEAVSAVVNFRDALAARGIRLIVMPAPNKESVYPERLWKWAKPPTGVLSADTREFLKRCEASGVEVIDLFAVFRNARSTSSVPLYLAQDSHWSPDGLALAAAAVAERVCLTPRVSFDLKPVELRRLGDIVRMIRSPAVEKRVSPEFVACQQVVRRDTGALYKDDPASDVLVMGDSFLRIYEQDEPGSAGFVAHLARALQRPLSSIINDGGASTLVRQELARRPELLANKKVVIWEFVERDIRLGTEGWQLVPLPPAPTGDRAPAEGSARLKAEPK
ncbi:MAG: hypothetical protein AB9869_00760 [Verrucomicrobiia bacterium]